MCTDHCKSQTDKLQISINQLTQTKTQLTAVKQSLESQLSEQTALVTQLRSEVAALKLAQSEALNKANAQAAAVATAAQAKQHEQETTAKLAKQSAEHAAAIKALTDRLAASEAACNERGVTLERVNASLKAVQSEFETHRSQYTTTASAMTAQRGECEQLTAKIKDLQSTIQTRSASIDSLKSEMKELITAHATECERLRSEHARDVIARTESAVAAAQQKWDTKFATEQARAQKEREAISSAHTAAREQHARELAVQTAEHHTAIQKLATEHQTAREQHQKTCSALEQQISELKQQLTSVTQQLSTHKRQLSKAEKSYTCAAEAMTAEHRKQLSTQQQLLQTEIAALQVKLAERDREFAAVQNKYNTAIANHAAELKAVRISGEKATADALTQALATAKAQSQAAANEYLVAHTREREQLQMQSAEHERYASMHHEQWTASATENMRLSSRVNALEEQYRTWQATDGPTAQETLRRTITALQRQISDAEKEHAAETKKVRHTTLITSSPHRSLYCIMCCYRL